MIASNFFFLSLSLNIMNENILLIGYSSQNMASGVSLSFDSLIDGFKLIDYQPEVIYIVDSRKSATYGSFSLTRVKDSLKAIFEALQKIPNQEVIYMTISSSKLGFIRDMMIIWFAWFFLKSELFYIFTVEVTRIFILVNHLYFKN